MRILGVIRVKKLSGTLPNKLNREKVYQFREKRGKSGDSENSKFKMYMENKLNCEKMYQFV